MISTFLRFVRRLRGEAPGMSAGVPHTGQTIYYLTPKISIQTQVPIADVSYYQGEINFQVMRATGVGGVILRAGQRNWVDSRFRENWRKAKEAGLPRGSYWLYDSREDPRKQAALWWSLLKDDPGELVHAADLEESYGGPYGTPAYMRIFLEEFQRLSGLPEDKIIIYTGYYWWSQRVGFNSFFRRFRLWLAWYAEQGQVRVPLPWTEDDLLFWQYTSCGPGSLYGVSSQEIDLSWYCCEARAYSIQFHLGATPPIGGTMSKYYRWNADGANIRTSPSSGATIKGNLIRNDVIQVDAAKSGSWFPFQIARHADGSTVTLADKTPLDGTHGTFWATDSYFVEVSALPGPVTPPPPDPEPTPTSHVVELYVDGVLEFRKELPCTSA